MNEFHAEENGNVVLQMQSDIRDHHEEIFNAISPSEIAKSQVNEKEV